MAVGQRVHWIDDDRTRPLRLARAHHRIDQQEETQRFSRPRARGHDEALIIARLRNGTILVAVELDRRPVRSCCEYLAKSRIEHFLRDKLINRVANLKARIYGDERPRPKTLFIVGSINLSADFRRANLRKGASERLVSFYQRLIEIEDIYDAPSVIPNRDTDLTSLNYYCLNCAPEQPQQFKKLR